MAEVRIEEGNLGLSTLAAGDLYQDVIQMSGALDPSEPLTRNYMPFANEVARSLGVSDWPGYRLEASLR